MTPGKDLLGEALSSSFEAFRYTRETRKLEKDSLDDDDGPAPADLPHAEWYLNEFGAVLDRVGGSTHPKVHATVNRVVDLWEAGEKVLVFAFYRLTCRALRVHISQEIERRVWTTAERAYRKVGATATRKELESVIDRVQGRYFDDKDGPGRRALDHALRAIVNDDGGATLRITPGEREQLVDVMRRFLRVVTTLARCFPLGELDSIKPADAVDRLLRHADGSSVSWQTKFAEFVRFLTECSASEREGYLLAAQKTQTRGIRVEADEEDSESDTGLVDGRAMTLANVQVATGETSRENRTRLMRAFNTPFFPDILVCSEVMGEGVDLQRFCRHVIHHDLAWNPSTIEQRTGRIDRLGCKAEGRQPIVVYLPFLAGTAGERQFRVMSDREQWFRVVMGQDEVAKLIAPDAESAIPLPRAIADGLSFKLGL